MKCRTCGNDLQGNEYNCPFCGSCVDYTQAVEQAKAGREEGFTFLYENTYRNKLYIAMKYMKNEQDAMDVLQDAYIKAFARLDSLQDANAFPGWMSTIVANTAINALQKKKAVLFSDLQNENDEGDVFEYKKKDQNATTEAASEASDDTVTTEVTTKAEETTEVTTEEPTEVTTEAAIDESLYKAAYKEVLESYKTQIDNYFWQYEYDYSTKAAKEEQTPIVFADVTGDGVPEMILVRSEQNEASIAQMDIYSFDGTKAKRIFGTDMEEYGGWDINAASGTSYYLFTTKKGTLYAYSGIGDEGYTDQYIKFALDDSGMLQKATTWARKEGPNEDYSATVVSCTKNESEISEDKYDTQVKKLQKNFDTLLMYNGQGKDKAKEVLGTLDDTAMTYDEAMEYLGKITQKKTDKTASDKKQEKSADKKEVSAGNAGEVAMTLPEDLPEKFILTSGVGAWGASMDIKPDGTFTASYYDSNYEGRSTSSGSGSFKNIKQVDKYTYTMELDTLKYDDEIGKVVANDNGYKTTFTELYGIAGGTTFTVYLPGAPTADMPEGMKRWLGFHYYSVPIPETLDCYAIYNVDTEYGYFNTGLQ